MAPPSFEIIARDAERESIDALLGRPRPLALVIEGEAGIGKTTLWSYACRAAAAHGDRVLAWRASSAERELAFGALMGLLDGDLDATIESLLPARRRALDLALGRIGSGARAPEPSLVGLAVLDLIRELAADAPVIVGLDDAQWCDPASAAALAFAGRRLRSEPVAFLLAIRTGQSGSGASGIEASLPEDRRERIEVGPLTIGALGRLIHERNGVAHPRPLLVRIHEASGGNPFVGLEMSRSLISRGVAPVPGEPFPVSPQAGPLVRDHLSSLSDQARDALLVVAMASQPTIGLLDRVLGGDASVAVDEACRNGVLVAEGDRLRAAHPLFASTAYADALPGQRRRLRRALAEAIDDPLERAIQRAATVDRADAAVASELEAAARISLQRGAPGMAAELFARAAGLADAADAPRLRIGSSAARLNAGDTDGAATTLRTVLAEVPDGRVRADALLALGEIVYMTSPQEALPHFLEALEHTEGDLMLEARVHSYIGGMGDADRAASERSAHAALEILQRPGVRPEPDHLACALLERAFQWLLTCDRLAAEDIDRATRLMTRTGDSFVARRAQELAERCLYHVGRLRESLALDELEYRRMVEVGQLGLVPPLLQSMAVLEQLVGDWPAARRYARACVDLVEQGEEVWRERAVLATARVLASDGELEAARSMALESLARQDAEGDAWEAVIFSALLGFIELSVPDPPAALAYLTRASAYAEAVNVALPTVFRYMGDLVEAAVLSGDLDLAEIVLNERLEAPAARIPLPWILAVAGRGRGLLSAARLDLDGAIQSFDRSLEALDGTPMPFERGRTLLARGRVQLKAGRRRMARADLEAALAIFDDLGAAAWAGHARADLARIGGRTSSRWELTPSERSVAALAATGGSNREIADQLVLSVRTVESHLASAYRKLDVRSRVQLASALAPAADETSPTP